MVRRGGCAARQGGFLLLVRRGQSSSDASTGTCSYCDGTGCSVANEQAACGPASKNTKEHSLQLEGSLLKH